VEACALPPRVLDCAHSLCDSCQSTEHDTNSCPHVIAMASRLNQLEHEMNTYRESMENMTCAFMNRFFELVKVHIESTMFVLLETDLRV